MDLVGLEILQQVVDLLVGRNVERLADKLLPAELVATFDVGHQVLDVERTLDVIQILVIDGDIVVFVL